LPDKVSIAIDQNIVLFMLLELVINYPSMIKIQNTKGINAAIFFAAIKSTFTDFINDDLKTKLVFEFTKTEDTVVVNQPAIKEKGDYTITFVENEVLVIKADQSYHVPLFEERLIAFIHIAVDQA